jgi:hypothetical protein
MGWGWIPLFTGNIAALPQGMLPGQMAMARMADGRGSRQ